MKWKVRVAALIVCSASMSTYLLAQVSSSPAPVNPSTSATDLAPPSHPATPAQIREYLALTSFAQNAHKAMSQMLRASRITAAPYYTSSFWDDMDKAMQEIDLLTAVIPAYQKYFSEEDMAGTIAFYKSPPGQRLLAAQPFITSAAQDVLRSAGQAAGEQVGLKHKDEIEALKKKSEAGPPANTAPDRSTQQPK